MTEEGQCVGKEHYEDISKVCLSPDCQNEILVCASCEGLHQNHKLVGKKTFEKQLYPQTFPNSCFEKPPLSLEYTYSSILNDYKEVCDSVNKKLLEIRECIEIKFGLLFRSFKMENGSSIEERVRKYNEMSLIMSQFKLQNEKQISIYCRLLESNYEKDIKYQLKSILNCLDSVAAKKFPFSVKDKRKEIFHTESINLLKDEIQSIDDQSPTDLQISELVMQQCDEFVFQEKNRKPARSTMASSVDPSLQGSVNSSSSIQFFRFSPKLKASSLTISGNGSNVSLLKSLPKSDIKPFMALTTEPISKYNRQINLKFSGDSQKFDGICFGLTSQFRARQKYFVDNYSSEYQTHRFFQTEAGLLYQNPYSEIKNTNLIIEPNDIVLLECDFVELNYRIHMDKKGSFRFGKVIMEKTPLFPMVRINNPELSVSIV